MLAEAVSITPEEMAAVMAALVVALVLFVLLLVAAVLAGATLGNLAWKRQRPGRVFAVPIGWTAAGTVLGGVGCVAFADWGLWPAGFLASFAFGFGISRLNDPDDEAVDEPVS